jgi:phosphomannomutase/phosphoglucomutase
MIPQNIFRAYDIRGKYGSELNAESARLIGKAFVTYVINHYKIQNPKIVVGRDNRTHGKELQNAFIKGLTEHGAHVFKLEDSTSPMLYFAVCEGNYDAGVNVSASHNPAEYNGFKLVGREAHSICGTEIQAIKKMIEDQQFAPESKGTVEDVMIEEDYYEKISSIIKLKKPLKIVMDAANGIAGKHYPELFRRLGCTVIELYCDQDGRFPNHEPDPVVEANTEDLKKAVLENKADLGISFDGDGDRCAIVDELGKYHDANETFVLLIRDILSRHPGTSVVYTVSNSLIVPEEIKLHGGIPKMVPVGHSHVEVAMHETKALLGGEQSGHFFVAEKYYGFDDAAYVSAKLLEYFSASDKTVSEQYSSIPLVYSKPEFRPFCSDEQKFKVIENLAIELGQSYKCNTMDGVRVEFDDGAWFGVRASNTSPCLSLCMEAKDSERLQEVYKLAKDSLKKHEIVL